MKKNIVRIITLVLIVMMLMPAFHVSAKSDNVTKSFKNKSKVVHLIKEFRTFAGLEIVKMRVGQAKKYSFSKNKYRKMVIKTPTPGLSIDYVHNAWKNTTFSKRSLEKLSKNIFGRATKNIGKPLVGDWGGVTPEIKRIKIYRTGKKTYIVKAKIKWFYPDENVYREGGTIIWNIKRKKGTHYGYIVKSMKIKKTGGYPEW